MYAGPVYSCNCIVDLGNFDLICSFNKLLAQKEELEQKHLHLLQIVESEKTAKWQYTRQCEELTDEIKQLRTEVRSVFTSRSVVTSDHLSDEITDAVTAIGCYLFFIIKDARSLYSIIISLDISTFTWISKAIPRNRNDRYYSRRQCAAPSC